jgi:hypothetical protein
MKMSEFRTDVSQVPDRRRYEINGKKYDSPTYNICKVCTYREPPAYLWVKQRLASGDLLLECPTCDNTETIGAHMLKLRP